MNDEEGNVVRMTLGSHVQVWSVCDDRFWVTLAVDLPSGRVCKGSTRAVARRAAFEKGHECREMAQPSCSAMR
jgi:hypothetical protein